MSHSDIEREYTRKLKIIQGAVVDFFQGKTGKLERNLNDPEDADPVNKDESGGVFDKIFKRGNVELQAPPEVQPPPKKIGYYNIVDVAVRELSKRNEGCYPALHDQYQQLKTILDDITKEMGENSRVISREKVDEIKFTKSDLDDKLDGKSHSDVFKYMVGMTNTLKDEQDALDQVKGYINNLTVYDNVIALEKYQSPLAAAEDAARFQKLQEEKQKQKEARAAENAAELEELQATNEEDEKKNGNGNGNGENNGENNGNNNGPVEQSHEKKKGDKPGEQSHEEKEEEKEEEGQNGGAKAEKQNDSADDVEENHQGGVDPNEKSDEVASQPEPQETKLKLTQPLQNAQNAQAQNIPVPPKELSNVSEEIQAKLLSLNTFATEAEKYIQRLSEEGALDGTSDEFKRMIGERLRKVKGYISQWGAIQHLVDKVPFAQLRDEYEGNQPECIFDIPAKVRVDPNVYPFVESYFIMKCLLKSFIHQIYKSNKTIANLVLIAFIIVVVSAFASVWLLIKVQTDVAESQFQKNGLRKDSVDYNIAQATSFKPGGRYKYGYLILMNIFAAICILAVFVIIWKNGGFRGVHLEPFVNFLLWLTVIQLAINILVGVSAFFLAKKKLDQTQKTIDSFNTFVIANMYKTDTEFLKIMQAEPPSNSFILGDRITSLLSLIRTTDEDVIAKAFFTINMYIHFQKLGSRKTETVQALDQLSISKVLMSAAFKSFNASRPGDFLHAGNEFIEDKSVELAEKFQQIFRNTSAETLNNAVIKASDLMSTANNKANSLFLSDAVMVFYKMAFIIAIAFTAPVLVLGYILRLRSTRDGIKAIFESELGS